MIAIEQFAPVWTQFRRSVFRWLTPSAKPIRRTDYRRPRLERLENRIAPAGHDTLASAMPLSFDDNHEAQISGLLADPNQVDLYAVLLKTGDQVNVGVRSQVPGSLQSTLRAFDASGKQLPFQQSTGNLGFDAVANGLYYVGVSSDSNVGYNPTKSASSSGGITTGVYALSLHQGSVLVTESVSNGSPTNMSPGTAQPLAANSVLSGFHVNGATEYYRYTVTAPSELTVTAFPAEGTSFLPRLTLYGSAGQLLIQADAPRFGNGLGRLQQHLPNGTYYLAVSAIADNPQGNQDYILESDLTPTSSPLQPLPIPAAVAGGPETTTVADFNHDGNLDIVTADIG